MANSMSGNNQAAIEEVQSPCIGVCSMNDATGFCHGCYRTTEEIASWWDMNPSVQKGLLKVLDERQSQSVSFDE